MKTTLHNKPKIEISRVFDVLQWQKKSYPQSKSLNSKQNGNWKNYSTDDTIAIVDNLSLSLLELGVDKSDKVAIISSNRPEWVFVDLALQQIGAISIPMYPTISVADYQYIFAHSSAKYVFVGDAEIAAKAKEAQAGTDIQKIYAFDKLEGFAHWEQLLSLADESKKAELQERKKEIKATDLLTIVYTSGTTGKPKGVMITHDNIVQNILCAYEHRLPDYIQPGNVRTLSFLPLCHIAERAVTFLYLALGAEIYYAESLESIKENIQEVKPHMFFAVPRLLEKMYDKIIAKGYDLPFPLKNLFFWSVNLGLKYVPHKRQGLLYKLKLRIADKLIFKKWREALGGNIELILVGAAPLQPRLGQVFWAAGIRIGEAYGLTETTPLVSCSLPTKMDIRLGYAGMIMEGIEVKLADDGEILVKGWNVMQGYYKEPELTAEVMKNGWFHTGDIGQIAEGKYLKITDRKKEIFKTSGGKYIAPGYLENKLKESMFIEQVMVLGEGEKFPAALIVPNFERIKDYCEIKQLPFKSNEQVVQHPSIIDKMEREVYRINQQFGKWEQVKKIKLLPELWSIEGEELTPTMKLKRRVVLEKFKDQVEGFYR